MNLGRNSKRTLERHARNFGAEADAVRGMSCLACRAEAKRERDIGSVTAKRFGVGSEPAHNPSIGAGGGRFDIVPLCAHHHAEQHQHGVKTFAAKYGLDLRAEADRVALGHERPLGIRGLADRHVVYEAWEQARGAVLGIGERWVLGDGDPLDTYETDALRGWLVRRMEHWRQTWDGQLDADGIRGPLAFEVARELDLVEEWGVVPVAAFALCEWAGWPS